MKMFYSDYVIIKVFYHLSFGNVLFSYFNTLTTAMREVTAHLHQCFQVFIVHHVTLPSRHRLLLIAGQEAAG